MGSNPILSAICSLRHSHYAPRANQTDVSRRASLIRRRITRLSLCAAPRAYGKSAALRGNPADRIGETAGKADAQRFGKRFRQSRRPDRGQCRSGHDLFRRGRLHRSQAKRRLATDGEESPEISETCPGAAGWIQLCTGSVLFQQHPSKIKSLGLWERVVLHCLEDLLS
jgi:hypothetical protein